jgi:hypothetical protein
MVTFWIIPLIVMVVFFAIVEWTSKPPRKAKGSAQDVAVPRPRKEIRDDMTTRMKRSG